MHPEKQKQAISASLEELGWVKPVIYNARTCRLIDGHARVESVPKEQVIPVFVVDLSEEQEAKALAIVDSITSMAEADEAQLRALLDETDLTGELSPVAEELELLLDPVLAPTVEDVGKKVNLKMLETDRPPVMTWILIGIPTVQFGKINTDIERIAQLPDVICEMTVNDDVKEDRQPQPAGEA